MCSPSQIVALTPRYCRSFAAFQSNYQGLREVGDESLSLSCRHCLIRRIGGAQ